MADNLERRRLAIAEALRAVMAEPAPSQSASSPHSDPTEPVTAGSAPPARTGPDHAVTAMPHQSRPAVVTQLRPRRADAHTPSLGSASELPSIRDALSSQIDWEAADAPPAPAANAPQVADEDESAATATASVETEATEIHAVPDTDGDADSGRGASTIRGSDSDDDPEPDPDPTSAGIPPIDTVGSMSRVASLALFGHA